MTALTRLASLLGLFDTIPFANRNYIVDGNFDNWTVSSVTVAANTYNATTMFRSSAGTGGTASLAQGPFVGNESSWMTTPAKYYANFNQTVASTGTVAASTAPFICQNVESVRTLQGRSATFSVTLGNPGAAFTIPSILFRQIFGTGGSPSANINIDKAVNWVVPTGWSRFSVRLDIPSISGKTLGTNGDDVLQIGLWFPPGVVFNAYTTQWQLEQSSPLSSSDINGKGGLPTAFEYRGVQAELARVNRYYEQLPFTISPALPAYTQVPYKVTKRGTPALAVLSGATNGATFDNSAGTLYGFRIVVLPTATADLQVAADARL